MVFFKGGKDRTNRSGLYVFGRCHTHPLITKINTLLAFFMAEDRAYAMGILLSVLVALLHVWLALALLKPSALPAKIKPVMIEVALLATPKPEKKPAPVVVEKKAPPPKIAPVISKPVKLKTAPAKLPLAKKKPPINHAKAELPESTAVAPPPVFKPVPLPPTPEAGAKDKQSPVPATKAAISAEKTAPAAKEKGYATCVSCPKIKYPTIAQRRGWEGSVLLKLQLAPDGHAENITIERSSGHSTLDEAAIANAKQSRFTVGNTGQARMATKLFEFKLDK